MGCIKSKRDKLLANKVSLQATVLIQAWVRRHLAKLELRHRIAWNILQKLQFAAERQQVDIFNFFDALLTHFPDAMLKYRIQSSGLLGDIKKYHIFQQKMSKVDQSFKWYKGPHLKFPLTFKDVDVLIDLFRKDKNNLLHLRYVGQILGEAARKLRTLPNFNKAGMEVSRQVTIVGDLYGHFEDLLIIFHKNGVPSFDNPYVFNGDLVDCGTKSLEVLLVVLALFLIDSKGVYLNRGNHEDMLMNARFGFLQELKRKYKENAYLLMPLIEEVYRFMPLGTIVDQRVLVVHSGISDTVNLDLLELLDRGKYVSLLCPPVGGTTGYVDKVEWKQILDIMWSDPQGILGCNSNVERGTGSSFGPDVSDKFCKRYRINYIVRSNDCVVEGFDWEHEYRVATVFSASNFYNAASNKGAYLRINPHLDAYFDQYMTSVGKIYQYSTREGIEILEKTAFERVCQHLSQYSVELGRAFRRYDIENKGRIKLKEWSEALDEVSGVHLPWCLLREKLAPPYKLDWRKDVVKYKTTLALLEKTINSANFRRIDVLDSLTSNIRSIETIFHLLDKDKSGAISIKELADALDLLEKHLHDSKVRQELLNVCAAMDENGDGIIDYDEFMEAFQMCSVKRTGVRHSWHREHGNTTADDGMSFKSFDEIFTNFSPSPRE